MRRRTGKRVYGGRKAMSRYYQHRAQHKFGIKRNGGLTNRSKYDLGQRRALTVRNKWNQRASGGLMRKRYFRKYLKH